MMEDLRQVHEAISKGHSARVALVAKPWDDAATSSVHLSFSQVLPQSDDFDDWLQICTRLKACIWSILLVVYDSAQDSQCSQSSLVVPAGLDQVEGRLKAVSAPDEVFIKPTWALI